MFYYENRKMPAWLSFIALSLCLLISLIIATQKIIVAGLVGAALVTLVYVAYWIVNGAKAGNLFVYLTLVCLFVFPFALKIGGLRLFGLLQIIVVIGGFLGIHIFYRHAKNQPVLKLSLYLFAGSLAWASLSSLVSERFNLLAFSYQFISDLKPILLISFCFFVWGNRKSERILWYFVDYFVWIAILFIALEWIMPGPYFKLFGAYNSGTFDPNGMFPTRAVGPFEHPANLASVAACFSMLTAARAICMPSQRRKYSFLALLYMVCLFCSVQRQELAGAVFAILAMLFLAKNIRWSAWHLGAIILILTVVPLFTAFFSADVVREASTWGIGNLGEISHPRAQQYAAALFIANESFPFGTGLGTFGGAGAEKYDLSLYYEMGFGKYWWFGKADYLLDTYWPNPIAEGGWIGFILLLAHYVTLGLYAIKNARQLSDPLGVTYWLFSGLGVWFLIANAFSSPVFQDPRLYFWVASAIALGGYNSGQNSSVQK